MTTIAELRDLLAKAERDGDTIDWWTNGLGIFDHMDQPVADVEDWPAGAALIVEAVNALPALLSAAEAAGRFVDEADAMDHKADGLPQRRLPLAYERQHRDALRAALDKLR